LWQVVLLEEELFTDILMDSASIKAVFIQQIQGLSNANNKIFERLFAKDAFY